jgi:hypothetical protein
MSWLSIVPVAYGSVIYSIMHYFHVMISASGQLRARGARAHMLRLDPLEPGPVVLM